MLKASPHYHARRAGRPGVHSLDHFGLAVPDLDVARHFYTSFGLDVQDADDRLELRCVDDPHVWGHVTEGPRKRLGHLCFGAYADDLPFFAERLAQAGIDQDPPSGGASANNLRFRDPHGIPIEIRAAEKVMPDAKPKPMPVSAMSGGRGAPMRGDAPPVRPRRLAHALMFTPDVEETIRFYVDVLGLGLSDYSGPLAFLHGVHGSDHHVVAFARSGDVGFHHCAWDVATLDEVGLGATQMAAAGYGQGWGLGRHVLGSNYFNYVRDPWGSYAEYSFDIDFISAEQNWTTGRPAPENSLYLWGPDVPPDFTTNYEAIG
jgi:catechol 2,3-dioxygenase-like lactoylglutathione lyase family enzyme